MSLTSSLQKLSTAAVNNISKTFTTCKLFGVAWHFYSAAHSKHESLSKPLLLMRYIEEYLLVFDGELGEKTLHTYLNMSG